VTPPTDQRRRPSSVKTAAASLVSMLAIAGLLFGLVGLLSAESVTGQLVAGVLLVGGGVGLARFAWRLYRGEPGVWRQASGLPPVEARAFARELTSRQWLTVAKLLLALVPVYLLLALLLEDHEASVGAAAVCACAAGALGLLSWSQVRAAGRRAG
jgi:hypothetical protein